MVSLNALEKIQRNILLFQYQLVERLIMLKILHIDLKFIDSFRLMSTSLSSLDDNLSEKPHSDKCKDCKSELDYLSIKNNQLVFLSVKRMIRKTIKN